jgi:hypothetical protein
MVWDVGAAAALAAAAASRLALGRNMLSDMKRRGLE